MPTFSYIASGPKGESIRGKIPASDKSDVAKQLHLKGLFLVSCRCEDEPVLAAIAAPAAPTHLSLQAGAGAAALPATSTASTAGAHSWWSNLLHRKEDPHA